MRIPRLDRSRRPALAAVGLTLAAAAVAAWAGARSLRTAEPPWWDVRMTVEGTGDYEVRPDASDARYAGSFAFSFAWSGALQKDDEDYLLVHKACRLTAWRIEERGIFHEAVTTLTTADIGDRPELKVGYILKRDGALHIAFEVTGFDVPKLAGGDAFPLTLPVSAEGGGGRKYDMNLKSGSNKVALDEGVLARGPEEKQFAWTWKSQSWAQKRDANVFQSSSHEARVRIVVTPGK
jgi:hypothetical protein